MFGSWLSLWINSGNFPQLNYICYPIKPYNTNRLFEMYSQITIKQFDFGQIS